MWCVRCVIWTQTSRQDKMLAVKISVNHILIHTGSCQRLHTIFTFLQSMSYDLTSGGVGYRREGCQLVTKVLFHLPPDIVKEALGQVPDLFVATKTGILRQNVCRNVHCQHSFWRLGS